MTYVLDAVQLAAKEKAKGQQGFGFFMEMGLGKSLLALDEFMSGVSGGTTRMLVVCPNSFKSGWIEEIHKHGINVEPYIFVSGASENRAFLERAFNRPPVLVVNYEAIRSESVRQALTVWMYRKPTYLVFDESIQIKTHNSQQTRASLELAKYAAVRRILTGKPTTQGPHDLWGQMRAIGQMEGRNFYAFRGMFCRMGGFKGKQVIGAQNEDILARMMDPHVFWAKKKDWLPSLPDKNYTVREYKLTPEQRSQYISMEHSFVLWLNDEKYVTVEAAISKYEKLAQIQCGFIIDTDDDGKVHVICPPERNPRLRLLKEILENEVEGKTIVVYTHRYTFEILVEALREYNPAWIKGGMKPDEIEHQKNLFNGNPGCRVILVQEKAGKYGHTLLGQGENCCATTIFYENSYSLDDRSQVEDRNHRRGQDQTVTYVDLCGTTMDRRVIAALQRKENIFQAIMKHIKEEKPI